MRVCVLCTPQIDVKKFFKNSLDQFIPQFFTLLLIIIWNYLEFSWFSDVLTSVYSDKRNVANIANFTCKILYSNTFVNNSLSIVTTCENLKKKNYLVPIKNVERNNVEKPSWNGAGTQGKASFLKLVVPCVLASARPFRSFIVMHENNHAVYP